MGAVLGLIDVVLLLVQLLLVVRALLDWSVALAGPSTAGSVRSRLTTVVYAVTEPMLAPVRRVIPPLRMGGVGIDLAFIVLFIAILLLRALLPG